MSDYESKSVRQLFRFLDDSKVSSIDSFYNDCLAREYGKYSSASEFICNIPLMSINSHDNEVFKHYSGYSYFDLNRAIKGTWTYEENGSDTRYKLYQHLASELQDAINSNNSSIGDVTVFRGVPLKYFREYGISSIEELKGLKDKYLLDKGFVSTSLVEKDSFFGKTNNYGVDYNVLVEYLVPSEFTDGVCLLKNSHYPGENEYLINAWNLAKVVDVKTEDNSAVVRALLIPKHVYDDYYSKGRKK